MGIQEKHLCSLLLSGAWHRPLIRDQQINELLHLGPYIFHILSIVQGGRKPGPTMVLAIGVAEEVTSYRWKVVYCCVFAESLPAFSSYASLRNNKKWKAVGLGRLWVRKSCLFKYLRAFSCLLLGSLNAKG